MKITHPQKSSKPQTTGRTRGVKALTTGPLIQAGDKHVTREDLETSEDERSLLEKTNQNEGRITGSLQSKGKKTKSPQPKGANEHTIQDLPGNRTTSSETKSKRKEREKGGVL